jgi:8-oxo-dGTP diphosphatase
MENFSDPVVSIIVQRSNGGPTILLQERSKASAGKFRGLLELPQGRLRCGESMLDCAVRELEEETGLTRFVPSILTEEISIGSEHLISADVTAVSQSGSQFYLAICLVGTAEGTPRASEEAANPRWYTRSELESLLAEGRIFPLNVPMLRRYLRSNILS